MPGARVRPRERDNHLERDGPSRTAAEGRVGGPLPIQAGAGAGGDIYLLAVAPENPGKRTAEVLGEGQQGVIPPRQAVEQ